MRAAYKWVMTYATPPPDPDFLPIEPQKSAVAQPHGDTTSPQEHNSETNADAAHEGRCGMTHLPTGRTCVLPTRHSGSYDFRAA